MSDNKVTFGLSDVHIAPFDETNQTQPAWETSIAIPGAVKLSLKAEGDSTPLYADNTEYFRTDTNNGYSGDIEFATLSDIIKEKIYGWKIDDNGALVEDANGKPKRFALMGQIEGDKANRRFVYYSCQASRSDIEDKTKEKTVDYNIEKVGITVAPLKIGDIYAVKTSLPYTTENKDAYDKFYESVYKPTFTPAA